MGSFGEYARNINKSWRYERFYPEFGGGKKINREAGRCNITHPENSRLVRKSTDRFVQVHLESTVVPSRSQDFAVANVEQIGCIIRG